MSALEQAWAAEETRPTGSGMSQNELIAEFKRLDAIVKESGAARREIGMALAGIAFEKKGDQNTVHLEGVGGRVKVQFDTETEYDVDQMTVVQDLLGNERFDELFKTKLDFVAKKRELKRFMNTVWPDEKLETAKKVIQDATHTRDKSPYVSVE